MFLNQFLAVKKDVIAGVYLGILRILSGILYRTPPGDAQKMKFSIKDFFSKYDQIRRKLWIWSHLLKKFLMENFIFCAVVGLHSSYNLAKTQRCCNFTVSLL